MEQVLCEMLSYRGYDNIEYNNNYWIAKDKNDKAIAIFFNRNNQKLCVKNINEFSDILNNIQLSFEYVIIVYSSNITSFAKQSLQTNLKYEFQLFNENELSFNILKHSMVPKHEILTKEEKQDFLKEYKINLKNIPRIFDTDPVIKFIYAKKGDIIKISRKSETSGDYNYYRIVHSNLKKQ